MADLKHGDKGEAVKQLQDELNEVMSLKEDGEFGPMTEAMVKAFQTMHRLTADGIVGALTAAALAKAKADADSSSAG